MTERSTRPQPMIPLVPVIVLVLNAVVIRASGAIQLQDKEDHFPVEKGRRRLLQDSQCTLYRKFVEYETGDSANDESWACQLSNSNNGNLDGEFFDVVESTGLLSAALANATSGESTLSLNGAFADTDSMQLFVPDTTTIELGGQEIILGREKVSPATIGIHQLLVIRVTDSNNLAPSKNADQLYKKLFDEPNCLKDQINDCSYGKLQIKPFTGATPSRQNVVNGIVDINVTDIASHEANFVQNAKITATALLGDLDDPRFGLVMFCLPTGPKGKAWAYANNKYSFFVDKWCGTVGPSMHEIGHNVGLGHSGAKWKGKNSDGVGLMGRNAGKGNVQMCYNAQKSYQLGWYDDKTETINPLDGKGTRTIKLNGIADYGRKNKASVVLRLEQTSIEKDFYVGYNLAKGINKDTNQDKGKLTIVRKDNGGPREYGQSTKIASLLPGQTYMIRSFNNEQNVQIFFKGIKKGNAKVVVSASDEPLEMKASKPSNGTCKKFVVELKTDNKPKETSWYITDRQGNAVAYSTKKYRKKKKIYREEVCLPIKEKPQRYKLTILDDGGNGVCCGKGNGWYKVIDDKGQTIVSGATFSNSKNHKINVAKASTLSPTKEPSTIPSADPTTSVLPSEGPSHLPTVADSTSPTEITSYRPSSSPTFIIFEDPTSVLSASPTSQSIKVSNAPSMRPTSTVPSNYPSEMPSGVLSAIPTNTISETPTVEAVSSMLPSSAPSSFPSPESAVPSEVTSSSPSVASSESPSNIPSLAPIAVLPSDMPSLYPSGVSSQTPSGVLSTAPSRTSANPTVTMSESPSDPSLSPSESPSSGSPSEMPSVAPSHAPSLDLSANPSQMPSKVASSSPSSGPSESPTVQISMNPSRSPSSTPSSDAPSQSPTMDASFSPSQKPSKVPSSAPSSAMPSNAPSGIPSLSPSGKPSFSASPSTRPTVESSLEPSNSPSNVPSNAPSNAAEESSASLSRKREEYQQDSGEHVAVVPIQL